MPEFLTTLTAKIVAGVVVLALIGGAFWYVVVRPREAVQAAAQAKGETKQAEAAAGAATDTLHIVVDRQAAEVRIIKTTEENTREIMAQSGAVTPVDPAVHAAGLRAICVHDGASDQPVCASVLHGDGGSDRPE